MTSGDFNSDGKTDLAVGAYAYSSAIGRAYVFYNDGTIPTAATSADAIITGESTSSNFGTCLLGGDFNNDGKTDLAVGASGYSSAGKIYIYTDNETTAVGEAVSSLGTSMIAGDFNADGKTDLAVGAYIYNSNQGRVYIFYNNGLLPTTAVAADVTITGEASSNFGGSFASGDFNGDGKTDLAVGAAGYSSNTGRAYIFYNDGNFPTTAAAADVIITGEVPSYFGMHMTAGDFNADGKIDLAVGAMGYSSNTGRVYIFYNDGSIPTTAATADVIITGESGGSFFGSSLVSGDFNSDGKTDLAVGAYFISTSTGKVYIFYNDGSIPTTAATADLNITGEVTLSSFGFVLAAGDFNADGKTDLAVGAVGYSLNTGRVYIFYNDGSIPTTAATADVVLTGESAGSNFGYQMMSGDLNADGKTDLIVGATGYASSSGKVYVYYNNNGLKKSFGGDVTIDSPAASANFGASLAIGEFSGDGNLDLIVGAPAFSSSAGIFYVYPFEASSALQAPITARGTFKIRGNVNFR
ncbi:MAG: FG-GAP repeat protein [Candidatus Moranbacteria bacterium]|nr:FG-GAP repeat protein [Candidatus Moranbacteria bacterium]